MCHVSMKQMLTTITYHNNKEISDSNTAKYSDYVFKKRMMMEQIESKLDQGLDRTLNAVIGWVKLYLQNEQKKTDYNKPDSEFDTLSSAVS